MLSKRRPRTFEPSRQVPDAAFMLGITSREVRALIDAGELYAERARVGSKPRIVIPESAIKGYAERKRRQAKAFDVAELHASGIFKTYFMQCNGADGPIKIGRTTDLPARLSSIQGTCPYEVKLLGVVDGDQEAVLHATFAAFHLRGEWFKPAPDLLAFIALEATGE